MGDKRMTPRTEAGREQVAAAVTPEGHAAILRTVLAIEQEAADAERARLDSLPRLWWCGFWGTLNEQRYHGNRKPCDRGGSPVTCGQVAYIRAADLAILDLRSDKEPREAE